MVTVEKMPQLLLYENELKRLRFLRDVALETMAEPAELEALYLEFTPLEAVAVEDLEGWRQQTQKECEYEESGNTWVEFNTSSERVGALEDTMGWVCPNACSYCPRQNRIDTDTVRRLYHTTPAPHACNACTTMQLSTSCDIPPSLV